jgi:hypothetical protein
MVETRPRRGPRSRRRKAPTHCARRLRGTGTGTVQGIQRHPQSRPAQPESGVRVSMTPSKEHLADILEDVITQACNVPSGPPGALCSWANTAYADGIRALADLGRAVVDVDRGRTVNATLQSRPPRVFIVTCMDEGQRVQATRRRFATFSEAAEYAATCHPSRYPLVEFR